MGDTISLNSTTPEAVTAALATGPSSQTPPVEPTDPSRPAWLPEKFKSPEDMANAYKELETKLGSNASLPPTPPPSADPQPTTDVNKIPDAPTADQTAAKETVEAVGLDFTKLGEEYQTSGSLSDATYKTLESKGIPKDVVDAYIAGQTALAEKSQQEIYGTIGGADNYKAMLAWAVTGVSEEAKAAYNDAVQSGNTNTAKLAVQGLYAQYTATNGKAPNLLQGNNGAASANAGAFQSYYEVTLAMSEKDSLGRTRYQVDPAYRQSVADRLARSRI